MPPNLGTLLATCTDGAFEFLCRKWHSLRCLLFLLFHGVGPSNFTSEKGFDLEWTLNKLNKSNFS